MTRNAVSGTGSTQGARGFVGALVKPVEAGLARTVELAAAVLLAIEIGVLFSGVVARYVFASPLMWSDELASILFLWLAMLGSAVAFCRGEHMRMTALVNRPRSSWSCSRPSRRWPS
jgi:TRAP-type C4-dicarboxylate transport system permease small subunit